jgi:formate/nitrite transporter FocA (FNT family)
MGLMYAAGTYDNRDLYTVHLAEKKVHYGWGQVFVRGIFANWLVGLATWMANAAQVRNWEL